MVDKEVVLNAFINSPRKSDFINKLGLDLSHKNGIDGDNELLIYTSIIGYSKRSDISGDAFRKRWKEKQYNDYMNNPKICPNCGKIIPFEKRNNKYCCQSCSATVTNKIKGPRSEETKRKISEGINKKILSGTYKPNNQYTCDNLTYVYTTILDLVNEGIITNPHNYEIHNKHLNKCKIIKKNCPICGKEYYGYITKYGNISTTYCSEECLLKSVSHKCSIKVQEKIANGTFQGWKTRNITSYAEKFWIEVLKNNNIDFIREYIVKIDNTHHYFLDFYIVKNDICIDLEIDGKQHKYEDRILHDKERDEFLTSKNILVYRIEWNEIKSDNGSLLMKEKINKFLIWYNNL